MTACRHCSRDIVRDDDGRWIDPAAPTDKDDEGHWIDDAVWRETCDAHDSFTAEHEPHDWMLAHPSATDSDGRPLYWDGTSWTVHEHGAHYVDTPETTTGVWIDACHPDH